MAVGNTRLMDREGIDLGNPRVGGRTFPRPVRTVVWVAVDGQAAALIGIGDAPRPTSATAVAALSKAGVEVVMLTGDNEASAQRIAGQLGIGTVIAEGAPQVHAAVPANGPGISPGSRGRPSCPIPGRGRVVADDRGRHAADRAMAGSPLY